MAFDRRLVSVRANDGPRWASTRPAASLPGGYPLDSRFGRPLERFTRTIPLTEHLLAAAQRMGRQWNLPEGVGAAAIAARPAQAHQLGRRNRRWHVCLGKKGGADVGKTKRGKGTKIMLLVDGNGTPLAAMIASASEAEVNLIEALIENRNCDDCPDRLLYDKAGDSDPLRETRT